MLISQGCIYTSLFKIEDAKNLYTILKMSDNKYPKIQAQALIGLGYARVENRVECYKKALEIAEKLKDLNLQAQALIGLGNAKQGKENFEKALEIAEKLGDKSLQAQALIGLGNASRDEKQSEKQLEYFRKVINLKGCPDHLKKKAETYLKTIEEYLNQQKYKTKLKN